VSRWGTPRLSEDVECLSVNSWIFIPDSHGFETSIAISFPRGGASADPKGDLAAGRPEAYARENANVSEKNVR
jgi:hypothetical protein